MRALIAMSGGVDSAAAALLMTRAGYDCEGCIMRLHDGETGDDDIADAAKIAAQLGIPFHVYDFRADFRREIMGYFAAEYLAGRTPNPCIECNRVMKFGRLLQCADDLGCDVIATGHYARIEEANGTYLLKKAVDESKDQSYVLYTLTQPQLRRVRLPLGGMTKPAVRQLAEEQGFLNARRKDSQDICFVPDGDYARVVQELTGHQPRCGEFVDLHGNVLGTHRGLLHYTVGQRRGLGIAIGRPAYVCGLDVPQNRVLIGDNADLFHRECRVGALTWTATPPAPGQVLRCTAKIRYRHTAQPALLEITADTARLVFDAPQRAMTPGQAAVFYDGDTLLGGGTIL